MSAAQAEAIVKRGLRYRHERSQHTTAVHMRRQQLPALARRPAAGEDAAAALGKPGTDRADFGDRTGSSYQAESKYTHSAPCS